MTTLQDIQAIYPQVSPHIRRTPLIQSAFLSDRFKARVYLKLENLQYTGSFKPRGVFSKISSLSAAEIERGFITASGGNHGLAVCFAARQFGTRALVYLPLNTPQYKIDKIKALGGEVLLHGEVWDDANAKAMQVAEQEGKPYLHPFDDEAVIRGQGTVAHEIFEDLPETDILMASIGGGGLISGNAIYAKGFSSKVRVYGVETVGADSMFQSLLAGQLVTLPGITSVAESLGAKRVTQRTFDYVKEFVNGVVTVRDEQAMQALTEMLQEDKILMEPASACLVGALESGAIPDVEGRTVVLLICGGNFSTAALKPYL